MHESTCKESGAGGRIPPHQVIPLPRLPPARNRRPQNFRRQSHKYHVVLKIAMGNTIDGENSVT